MALVNEGRIPSRGAGWPHLAVEVVQVSVAWFEPDTTAGAGAETVVHRLRSADKSFGRFRCVYRKTAMHCRIDSAKPLNLT